LGGSMNTGYWKLPISFRKRKGLASLQGLDFPTLFGSPTWARTRDLRINRRSVGSGCRTRQCSLSRVRTSNTFKSVSSISTGLERRIDYWILEASRLECLVARSVLFRRSRHRRRASACAVGPPDRRRSRTPGSGQELEYAQSAESGRPLTLSVPDRLVKPKFGVG
jgi:hypothetical protein